MSKPLFKAIIKSTRRNVVVYKHSDGSYVDWSNCETEYSKNDIQILNEIN